MKNQLWTPWRMEYIVGDTPPGCVLCHKPAEKDDRKNLVLYRGTGAFIIMNLFPYNPGHLMVVPYAHVSRLPDLSADVRAEIFELASVASEALGESMGPAGYNLGMNLGRVAGAGIADHLHLHIVPRWDGDTNFMPVLGETKVLPETLPVTYDKLKPILERLLR